MQTITNNIKVIGVDHGYGYTKTVNSIIKSGVVKKTGVPTSLANVIKFGNNYYTTGTNRVYKQDKTSDETYYILTLAAIAEELMTEGLTVAKVILAVGLPLDKFSAQSKRFKDYLLKNEAVSFEYGGLRYDIDFIDVRVLAQGYFATGLFYRDLAKENPSLISCDIGSWTTDVCQLNYGKLEEENIESLEDGVIPLINEIRAELLSKYNTAPTWEQIEGYIMQKENIISDKFKKIIKDKLIDFTNRIISSIIEHGYDPKVTPIIFSGGGAYILENYYPKSKEFCLAYYNTDIKLNVRAYEEITSKFEINARR